MVFSQFRIKTACIFIIVFFCQFCWAQSIKLLLFDQIWDQQKKEYVLQLHFKGGFPPYRLMHQGSNVILLELRQTQFLSRLPILKHPNSGLADIQIQKNKKGHVQVLFRMQQKSLLPKLLPILQKDKQIVQVHFSKVLAVKPQKVPSKTPTVVSFEKKRDKRIFKVAIDAGHGGKDPGAIGKGGTKEKDLTLAIAKKLYIALQQYPGVQPILVRKQDEFISLRKRIAIARAQKADLLISVHADAAPHQRAIGSSIFVLSQKGASSEFARCLAKKENQSDLLFGELFSNIKEPMVTSILLDLSQKATQKASVQLASKVLESLKISQIPVHRKQIEEAAFMVLKAPDIPSILVETGFISHPGMEKKLRDEAFQNKLAKALSVGIIMHMQDNHQSFRLQAPMILSKKNNGLRRKA